MNIISSLSPTEKAKNLSKLLTNASIVGWPDPSFVVIGSRILGMQDQFHEGILII